MFARDRELRQADQLMDEFDDVLYGLWKDMVQLEYRLKNADLRLITRWAEKLTRGAACFVPPAQ